MPRAKTARTSRNNAQNKILRMPENGGNGTANRADLEPEIRQRAYELYAERGYSNGDAEQDWYQAEQEILARHAEQHSA